MVAMAWREEWPRMGHTAREGDLNGVEEAHAEPWMGQKPDSCPSQSGRLLAWKAWILGVLGREKAEGTEQEAAAKAAGQEQLLGHWLK